MLYENSSRGIRLADKFLFLEQMLQKCVSNVNEGIWLITEEERLHFCYLS
jgi:hypothetical protein